MINILKFLNLNIGVDCLLKQVKLLDNAVEEVFLPNVKQENITAVRHRIIYMKKTESRGASKRRVVLKKDNWQ